MEKILIDILERNDVKPLFVLEKIASKSQAIRLLTRYFDIYNCMCFDREIVNCLFKNQHHFKDKKFCIRKVDRVLRSADNSVPFDFEVRLFSYTCFEIFNFNKKSFL